MDEAVYIIFGVVFAIVFLSVLISAIVKKVKTNKRNNKQRNKNRNGDVYYNGSGYGYKSHDFFDTPPAPRRKPIDPFGYDSPHNGNAHRQKIEKKINDTDRSESAPKCPACGSPKENEDKFCPYCGHKFG